MNAYQPMTDEELQRIEGLCAGTTKGPWKARIEGRGPWAGSDIVLTGDKDLKVWATSEGDFDFIASVRQDVPRLLEEVKALRAKLERVLFQSEPVAMNVHQSITEEELDRIERLCAGATGGPWQAFIEDRDHWGGSSFVRTAGEDVEMNASDGDYDFIASARQDVPRLLEEVRALRAELERLRRGEGS